MTYYPSNRGGGDTFHDHWSDTPHGSNSRHGPGLAKAHHKGWIDNDGTRTRDHVLINDHGYPLKVYFPQGRSTHFTWDEVRGRTYVWHNQTFHLRTIPQTLKDNAKTIVKGHPLGTEVEIKNLRPITPTGLEVMMDDLASAAKAAYGRDWQRYVIVKVCSGTIAWRLEVCLAAHKAGLRTLISVKGLERRLSFKDHQEVTYVRGSLNLRIRRKH